MMVYTFVQLFYLFCAFMSLGQAVNKDTNNFGKVCGYTVCMLSLAAIALIQGVLK